MLNRSGRNRRVTFKVLKETNSPSTSNSSQSKMTSRTAGEAELLKLFTLSYETILSFEADLVDLRKQKKQLEKQIYDLRLENGRLNKFAEIREQVGQINTAVEQKVSLWTEYVQDILMMMEEMRNSYVRDKEGLRQSFKHKMAESWNVIAEYIGRVEELLASSEKLILDSNRVLMELNEERKCQGSWMPYGFGFQPPPTPYYGSPHYYDSQLIQKKLNEVSRDYERLSEVMEDNFGVLSSLMANYDWKFRAAAVLTLENETAIRDLKKKVKIAMRTNLDIPNGTDLKFKVDVGTPHVARPYSAGPTSTVPGSDNYKEIRLQPPQRNAMISSGRKRKWSEVLTGDVAEIPQPSKNRSVFEPILDQLEDFVYKEEDFPPPI